MLRRSVFPLIQTKRAVVVIDGNGAIFHPSLITTGDEGGHEAVSRLTAGIASYLEPQQLELDGYISLNRRRLINTLKRHGYTQSVDTFDDFVGGFNDQAALCTIMEVGDFRKEEDNLLAGASCSYLDSIVCNRH